LQPRCGAAITRDVSLWLVIARADDASDTLRARLEAAIRVAASLDERLTEAGIDGIAGAAAARRRLAAVLAGIDAEGLSAARAAVAALEHELAAADSALARLRALKERLAALR